MEGEESGETGGETRKTRCNTFLNNSLGRKILPWHEGHNDELESLTRKVFFLFLQPNVKTKDSTLCCMWNQGVGGYSYLKSQVFYTLLVFSADWGWVLANMEGFQIQEINVPTTRVVSGLKAAEHTVQWWSTRVHCRLGDNSVCGCRELARLYMHMHRCIAVYVYMYAYMCIHICKYLKTVPLVSLLFLLNFLNEFPSS